MLSAPTPLTAPIRFVTTTNSESGLSSIWIKEPVAMAPIAPTTKSLAGNVWVSKDHLQDNLNGVDGAKLPTGMVEPNGSLVRIVDIPPGSSSFKVHFTNSIDYIYLIKGILTMELDDGSLTTIKEGEVLVQRGTTHSWHNRTGDWVRFLAVILPAKSRSNV